MTRLVYEASDRLFAQLQLQPGTPVLVSTVVSIDDVAVSSRLGRTVAEQVGSRLSQRGLRPIEAKLRGSLYISRHTGELLLSRELRDVGREHRADVVIVGTYSPALHWVAITLKAVRTVDSTVVAAADLTMPLDDSVDRLLR